MSRTESRGTEVEEVHFSFERQVYRKHVFRMPVPGGWIYIHTTFYYRKPGIPWIRDRNSMKTVVLPPPPRLDVTFD